MPLDAIPDLSDVQVIVYTEYPGQAPQVVEDQVTYPLTTAMLSVPKSRVVRGFSFFGVSFVYVIFEDGTDLYWARSRVLEYLSSAARRLPAGVTPSLGPTRPASAGSINTSCAASRRASPSCAPSRTGTSATASPRRRASPRSRASAASSSKYSVVIDPRRLQALGIPLAKVREACAPATWTSAAAPVELAETEFAVRGRGYIKSLADLEQIVVKSDRGVPVLLKDVARVELTPDERRGITEMDGEGEVVTGIALQRFGENALSVIHNVKDRLAEIAPSLPQGVDDRAGLRPLRPDLPRHRHAQAHADRGEPDRRAGLRRLPAARAQRAGRHHHAAARRADRLHLHVALLGHQLQHHEPRRHRHRHRRHGRRRHRDDRERPQAPGAGAARQAASAIVLSRRRSRSGRRCSSAC